MNEPLTTKSGKAIPEDCRGIVYLCDFNRKENTLKITKELGFYTPGEALEAYANIPNPESQMASGKTFEAFAQELRALHKRMDDPEWIRDLGNYL